MEILNSWSAPHLGVYPVFHPAPGIVLRNHWCQKRLHKFAFWKSVMIPLLNSFTSTVENNKNITFWCNRMPEIVNEVAGWVK